jgi:hypothetical protein
MLKIHRNPDSIGTPMPTVGQVKPEAIIGKHSGNQILRVPTFDVAYSQPLDAQSYGAEIQGRYGYAGVLVGYVGFIQRRVKAVDRQVFGIGKHGGVPERCRGRVAIRDGGSTQG